MSVSLTPTPGGYFVRFPFDDVVVDRFRSQIPKRSRRWDPDARAWFVASVHIHIAKMILEATWPGCTAVPPSAYTASGPHAALYLLPSAPPEVVKAAYRALSKAMHPDRGGDLREMQRINDAYDRIRPA